jgi:Arc/MetJ family transcription regulator
MKTTIDIPEDLLRDVKSVSGSRTIREAVTVALREYMRAHRSAELVDLLGSFSDLMDKDELSAQRSAE